MLSLMGPQHGRIIHAHLQGFGDDDDDDDDDENQDDQDEKKKSKNKTKKKKGYYYPPSYGSNLVIRLSQLYSFERAADAPFDLFVRYKCSFPIGDTTSVWYEVDRCCVLAERESVCVWFYLVWSSLLAKEKKEREE